MRLKETRFCGTDLHGMWLLGTRNGNVQYAPEDLRCLTAVGRQAALMLEATNYAETVVILELPR